MATARAKSVPLPARTRVALLAGRAATGLSRAAHRGRGSTVGGAVALRLDPAAMRRLARDRAVVLVTGTTGRSMTTRMIADAVRRLGPVASNATGANRRAGIVTALDTARAARYAVLEVDGRCLGEITRATRPEVVVLLNLSRECATGRCLEDTLAHWRETLTGIDWPCRVVANVDDPLVYAAARHAREMVGVSAGLPWPYDALLCLDCRTPLRWSEDDWWCTGCGLTRPQPVWTIDDNKIDPGAVLLPDLAIAGRSAPRGALLAVAAAAQLGVAPAEGVLSVAAVGDVDGRFAPLRVDDGHRVRLFPVRSPAGWREMVDLAATAGTPMVFAMDAWGVRDTAMLWDVHADLLGEIGVEVTVTGQRRLDLAAWLDAHGAPVRLGDPDPVTAIRAQPPGDVLVATNRPAFTALRRRLAG